MLPASRSSQGEQQKGASEDAQEGGLPPEIWENERHVLGFGWLPPMPLERPNFTDSGGKQVRQPWSVHAGGDWAVVVNDGTDLDGWQYGSYFHTLKKERPGGRASMRLTDGIRARRWVKLCELDAAATRLAFKAHQSGGSHGGHRGSRAAITTDGGGSYLGSPNTNAAVSYGNPILDRPDAKMRALRGFLDLLRDCLAERGLGGIPMDPLSYAVLQRKHAKETKELQERIMEAHMMRADGAHIGESMRRLMREAAVCRNSKGKAVREGAEEGQTHLSMPVTAKPMLLLDSHPEPGAREGFLPRDELIPELEAAVIFSRAAYGYALSAGYLNSVHSAIFMGTLKNIHFDVAGGASAEANNKALMMETGIQESDLLLTEWRNSVCRPCHFLAADRKRKRLVLSIRGSLELADLMTDGKADSMDVNLAGIRGKVHEGIFASATFVHCNTHSELAQAAERFPGWPLLVTGHSLGGGTAALLAMLLNEPGGCPPSLQGRVRCVAVGCPSVTSSALSRAAAPYVTSIVLRNDFIPRLSVANVDLLLQELVEASPIRNFTKSIGDFFTSSFAGRPTGSSHNHDNTDLELQQWRKSSGTALAEPEDVDGLCLGQGAFAPLWMMANSAEAAALSGPGSQSWPPPDMPPLAEDFAVRCATHKAAAPVELRSSYTNRVEIEAQRIEEAADVVASAFEDSTGIHIESSFALENQPEPLSSAGNQCPHGTGGVTKFDLLHPIGRCLWVVEVQKPRDSASTDGAAGEQVGRQSGSQQESREACHVVTTGINSSQRTLDMMDQAWNSSAIGLGALAGGVASSSGIASAGQASSTSKIQVDRRLEDACQEASGEAECWADPAAAQARRTPIAKLPWRSRFLECPAETFGRLHLHPEMINDHLPDSYASAVEQLVEWWKNEV